MYLNSYAGVENSAVKTRYNTYCISIVLQLRSDGRSAGVHFEIQKNFIGKYKNPGDIISGAYDVRDRIRTHDLLVRSYLGRYNIRK